MSHRIDEEGRGARQSGFDQAGTRIAYRWFSNCVVDKSLEALSTQLASFGGSFARGGLTERTGTLRRLTRCSLAAEVSRHATRLAGRPGHCYSCALIPCIGLRYASRPARVFALRAYLKGSHNDLMRCHVRSHGSCARHRNLWPFRHAQWVFVPLHQ